MIWTKREAATYNQRNLTFVTAPFSMENGSKYVKISMENGPKPSVFVMEKQNALEKD